MKMTMRMTGAAVLAVAAGVALGHTAGDLVAGAPAKATRPAVVLGPATMLVQAPCISRPGGWWRCTLDTGRRGWAPAVVDIRPRRDGSAMVRARRAA